MSKNIIVSLLLIVFLISAFGITFAGQKEVKMVADWAKYRLQWAGFWYGPSRMGLPYGQRLPMLIKDDGSNIFEVAIDYILDIPGFDGEVVPFNTYIIDNGKFIEKEGTKSHLKYPDELDKFKNSGAIYEEDITLSKDWRPVQGTDSASVRILKEILFDLDKFFTTKMDSFPGLNTIDTLHIKINPFTAQDREVFALPEGIDLIFAIKIHQPFVLQQFQHYFWDKKETRFFNPNIIKKVVQYGKIYTIYLADNYPTMMEEMEK